MRQSWRGLGRVHVAAGRGWATSHASYPVAVADERGTLRVFYSPRDEKGRSSIAALDLSVSGDAWKVSAVDDRPLLLPGKRGAFDDSGVTVGCLVRDGDAWFLYYLGWSLGTTVPFRNFIGLAAATTLAGPFERVSETPVVDRGPLTPYSLGYPWVVRTGSGFRMWFGSHVEWGEEWLAMRHVVRSARSDDGIRWRVESRVALDLEGREYALSRPCVRIEDERWRMWLSRRDPGYALAYAESDDAETWRRMDDAVTFERPPEAWEDESREYASVFEHDGSRYMLYNGNGYGRTGFGIARDVSAEHGRA